MTNKVITIGKLACSRTPRSPTIPAWTFRCSSARGSSLPAPKAQCSHSSNSSSLEFLSQTRASAYRSALIAVPATFYAGYELPSPARLARAVNRSPSSASATCTQSAPANSTCWVVSAPFGWREALSGLKRRNSLAWSFRAPGYESFLWIIPPWVRERSCFRVVSFAAGPSLPRAWRAALRVERLNFIFRKASSWATQSAVRSRALSSISGPALRAASQTHFLTAISSQVKISQHLSHPCLHLYFSRAAMRRMPLSAGSVMQPYLISSLCSCLFQKRIAYSSKTIGSWAIQGFWETVHYSAG